MRRFEFKKGTHNKFWEIELNQKEGTFTTWWGKIDQFPQKKTKAFFSKYQATNEYEKIIGEKLKKGYKEVTGEKEKVIAAKVLKAIEAQADEYVQDYLDGVV